MTQHEDEVRLGHMLAHAREAMERAEGRSLVELREDRDLQLILTRLVEIVGEAAYKLSPAFQQSHPQIPWHQIIVMRHRLIHDYDFVDYGILWQTVDEDLPILVTELEELLP